MSTEKAHSRISYYTCHIAILICFFFYFLFNHLNFYAHCVVCLCSFVEFVSWGFYVSLVLRPLDVCIFHVDTLPRSTTSVYVLYMVNMVPT